LIARLQPDKVLIFRQAIAIMAFENFTPKLDVISMAELGERIARRRAQLDELPVPRNFGERRTASKLALLKAIEDAGGKW
jgi:hypothetical protein